MNQQTINQQYSQPVYIQSHNIIQQSSTNHEQQRVDKTKIVQQDQKHYIPQHYVGQTHGVGGRMSITQPIRQQQSIQQQQQQQVRFISPVRVMSPNRVVTQQQQHKVVMSPKQNGSKLYHQSYTQSFSNRGSGSFMRMNYTSSMVQQQNHDQTNVVNTQQTHNKQQDHDTQIISKLQEQIEQLLSENKRIVNVMEQNKQEEEGLKSQNQKLNDNNMNQHDQLLLMGMEIERLHLIISEKNYENQRIDEELEQQIEGNHDKNNMINRIRNECEQQVEQMMNQESIQQQLEQVAREQEEKIIELIQEIERQKENQVKSNQVLEEYQSNNLRLERQLVEQGRQEDTLREYENRIALLTQEVERLNMLINNRNQEIEEVSQKIEVMRSRLSELEQLNHRREEDNQNMQIKMDQDQTQNIQIQNICDQKYRELEQAYLDQKELFHIQKIENDDFNNKLVLLNQQIQNFKQKEKSQQLQLTENKNMNQSLIELKEELKNAHLQIELLREQLEQNQKQGSGQKIQNEVVRRVSTMGYQSGDYDKQSQIVGIVQGQTYARQISPIQYHGQQQVYHQQQIQQQQIQHQQIQQDVQQIQVGRSSIIQKQVQQQPQDIIRVQSPSNLQGSPVRYIGNPPNNNLMK